VNYQVETNDFSACRHRPFPLKEAVMSPSPISALRLAQTLARLAIGLGLLTASCAEGKGDAPVESVVPVATASPSASPGDLDVLFMIDDSSSMTVMQQKLTSQIPGFITALQSLPMGLPNIHIAVVSSDLGAPGDSTSSIQCTPTGDQGKFQTQPRGTCTSTTLAAGETFISNVGGVANYTGNLADVLSCISLLGDAGCGFEHQLASVARALGSDGSPAPVENAGFLRPGADLAIIFLTNEDDCSAPSNTMLYSLNGYQQNIGNPLGPIANFRCNSFGHLCVDPTAGGSACLLEPQLKPPVDVTVTASASTLNLTDCESNDSNGLLTPVSNFVKGIKALKANPESQIVVGAITAPATPYAVAWVPESGGQNTQPGELWPEIEHSCGPAGGDDVNPTGQSTTDGSFGDPSVRITQLVGAFGSNGVVSSICDADYGNAFSAIVNRIGAQLQGGTAGSSTGTAGASGTALPICANGINPGSGDSGLKSGGCGDGCAVGAAHPGALSLASLGILIVLSRRRRKSLR
jgi:hypothetical protein